MKRCRSDLQRGAARGVAGDLGGWWRACVVVAVIAGLLAAPKHCAYAAGAEDRVKVAELTPEVENAIDRGLKFLAGGQAPDGSWGQSYKVASTSLTLMAFALKGHFPKKGQHGLMLDRGVEYLLKRSNEGAGYMGVNMYEHGLATLALSEVWGMSDREEIRDALKRGVEVILKAQDASGGWRYDPRPAGADVSVTAMQLVALSSAREAGILVPAKTIEKAVKYVKGLQVKANGGFGYVDASGPIFSRSAAGLMSLMICGQHDTPAVQNGLKYLKNLPDSKFTNFSGFFMYGHYYAVQSMYQAGEDSYQDWYPHIRDSLLVKQQPSGYWGAPENGEAAYGTSMAILILGVPYRYLPIYQR